MSQKDPLVPVVVLVTGCSSGIGRQLALTFKANRCRVFASARNIRSLESLEAEGIETLQMDVTDSASIEHGVNHVLEKAGRLDILVNNAGLSSYQPAVESPMDQIREVFETNFFGMIALTQLVASKVMIPRRSGKILQISSIAGESTTPWNATYGASKAAVTHFSDALRMELAPFNVKVIIAKPGGIKSDISKNASSKMNRTGESFYDRIWDEIEKRAYASQTTSMKTEDFANYVVGKVLKNDPPKQIIAGGHSAIMRVFSHLPYWLTDALLSKALGVSRLTTMIKEEKKSA